MADHCHNTPGLPGETISKPSVKTIKDLQCDATMLHGFAQGVYELYDLIQTDLSPASNAMPALLESLLDRADRLSVELDALDSATRGVGR